MAAVLKADKLLGDLNFYISNEFHPYLHGLRVAGSIHWTQAWPDRGFWSVVRHREIADVLLMPSIFSSEERGNFLPPDPHMFDLAKDRAAADFGMVPGFTDAPRHGLVRKQVAQPFLPQMVAQLADDCQRICDAAVENVLELGECDFVTDLVAKIPMHVIRAFMGVPRADWDSVAKCANAYISFAELDHQLAETPAEIYHLAKDMLFAYADNLLRWRSKDPKEHFTGLLMKATVGDVPLPKKEMCWWMWNVLLAALDTSRIVMSHGLLALLENPEEKLRLRENPGMANDASEEFSRWDTPAHSVMRVATQDAMIGNQPVLKGDWIVLWLKSANRDESVYVETFKLDITRRPNPHLAFGLGAHNCIGRRVAPLGIRLLLNTVLARLESIEVAGPVAWSTGMAMGLKHLPIRFQPRTR